MAAHYCPACGNEFNSNYFHTEMKFLTFITWRIFECIHCGILYREKMSEKIIKEIR